MALHASLSFLVTKRIPIGGFLESHPDRQETELGAGLGLLASASPQP